MDVFKSCGITEHSGHGVPEVVKVYGDKAYKFSTNTITVTIPFDLQKFYKNGTINGTINGIINDYVSSFLRVMKLVRLLKSRKRNWRFRSVRLWIYWINKTIFNIGICTKYKLNLNN